MKAMSHKEALTLVDNDLLSEEALAAGIEAGIISPPSSNLREYISDRGTRISMLLKELKPFKPIEFVNKQNKERE